MAQRMTHVDEAGRARMVDVSKKKTTRRKAVASARVTMARQTLEAIEKGAIEKGEALAVARVAGIAGAKETSRLIPLCHNIVIDKVTIDFSLSRRGDKGFVDIWSEAVATGRTGVEMEALTACSVAALSLYDMCKAIDRGMTVERLRLESKEGGRSGRWQRT